jgi:hypothetical protein
MFHSHGHCAPITRRPCSEGESHVRGTLSSRPTVGEAECRRIIICVCRQQRGVCEVCVVSEAVRFEVSTAMKVNIVIFWVKTLCSLTGGDQPGSYRQLCYSEMLGILL